MSILLPAREAYTLESWPLASSARCETFRAEGYEDRYEDLYCLECAVVIDDRATRYRFYPDLAKNACTLQSVLQGGYEPIWSRDPLLSLNRTEFVEPTPRRDDRDELAMEAGRDAGLDCARMERVFLENDREEALALLEETLGRMRAVSSADRSRAPFVYFVDALARHVGIVAPDETTMQRLAWEGLVYEGEYDSQGLRSPWLAELAARDVQSKWGQRAFLHFLRHVAGDEASLGEAFRPVVAHGEQFLRAHPGSAITRDVVLEVARAHETWWSISKMATGDYADDEDIARWKVGADHARLRALALYRRLARTEPSESLNQRIFRLDHDIDTGQRAYVWWGC